MLTRIILYQTLKLNVKNDPNVTKIKHQKEINKIRGEDTIIQVDIYLDQFIKYY